jgi:hypothetical protein
MADCVHPKWIYIHNMAGTCSYKVCVKCGISIFFAKKGC